MTYVSMLGFLEYHVEESSGFQDCLQQWDCFLKGSWSSRYFPDMSMTDDTWHQRVLIYTRLPLADSFSHIQT